jgi:hypothetical protein
MLAYAPRFLTQGAVARTQIQGTALYQQQELVLAGKSSISLVSVQKPTANTPTLQRRIKLTANIEQQITKIGLFREGKRISREQDEILNRNGNSYERH